MAERNGLDSERKGGDGLDGVLADLEKRSTAFGAALTGALKGAAQEGRGLEDVLRRAGERLSGMALNAALKPLDALIGNTISTALSALTGGTGAKAGATPLSSAASTALFAPGGLAAPQRLSAALSAQATELATPSRAESRAGQASDPASAALAAGPSITFHVTTPDADSFRKSEGQIAAMLTRAVGRGRRGV
ncbi:phage tail tape measure protein [Rhizobium sp. YIM 134829]|uniref:phage tail tape measure protein n=1 Tax=Rhizobium sp. YIM 134829 TaxID=3390453 RepID=UPI00397BE9CA